MRQLAIVALLAGLAHAAELAVLHNGFSISHLSREVIGDNTRLHIAGGGYVDVPTAQIEHFERDEAPAPQSQTQPAATPPIVTATAATAATRFDLDHVIAEASGKHYIDPDLIHSIIRQESGGNAHARSNKGAQGLMQLMPGTAAKLGVTNAYDPNANVDAGTRYFRELLERYNGDMIRALAAYNAGPHRVDQYKGVPPYSETRRYVAAIVHDFNRKKLAQMAAEKKAAEARKSTIKKKNVVAAADPAASAGGVQ